MGQDPGAFALKTTSTHLGREVWSEYSRLRATRIGGARLERLARRCQVKRAELSDAYEPRSITAILAPHKKTIGLAIAATARPPKAAACFDGPSDARPHGRAFRTSAANPSRIRPAGANPSLPSHFVPKPRLHRRRIRYHAFDPKKRFDASPASPAGTASSQPPTGLAATLSPNNSDSSGRHSAQRRSNRPRPSKPAGPSRLPLRQIVPPHHFPTLPNSI